MANKKKHTHSHNLRNEGRRASALSRKNGNLKRISNNKEKYK